MIYDCDSVKKLRCIYHNNLLFFYKAIKTSKGMKKIMICVYVYSIINIFQMFGQENKKSKKKTERIKIIMDIKSYKLGNIHINKIKNFFFFFFVKRS